MFALNRKQILTWVTGILGILFLTVLILDSYILYTTVLVEKTREINTVHPIAFPEEKIQNVIRILDERKKQFDEIKNQP